MLFAIKGYQTYIASMCVLNIFLKRLRSNVCSRASFSAVIYIWSLYGDVLHIGQFIGRELMRCQGKQFRRLTRIASWFSWQLRSRSAIECPSEARRSADNSVKNKHLIPEKQASRDTLFSLNHWRNVHSRVFVADSVASDQTAHSPSPTWYQQRLPWSQ